MQRAFNTAVRSPVQWFTGTAPFADCTPHPGAGWL